MYENYRKIRDSKGLKDSEVAKQTGLHPQMFSDWKRGKGTPKADKLLKIANFFEVPLEYLITGEIKNGYYLDDDVAKIAQELHDSEDLRILFDATRKATKEDLQMIVEIVKRFNK